MNKDKEQNQNINNGNNNIQIGGNITKTVNINFWLIVIGVIVFGTLVSALAIGFNKGNQSPTSGQKQLIPEIIPIVIM